MFDMRSGVAKRFLCRLGQGLPGELFLVLASATVESHPEQLNARTLECLDGVQ